MSAINCSEALSQLRLPCRPQKKDAESEIGHVFRTANANGISGRCLSKRIKTPMRHGLAKFCPACLAESPVFKAEWAHPDAMWCDSHELWLMDTCTRCLKPQCWQRDLLLQCSCGKFLSTNSSTPITELSVESTHWVKGRSKRLPGLPRTGTKQRLALAMLVGAYVVTNGQDLPLHKRHGSSVESKRALLVAGLSVLTGWPHRFDSFLDDLYWRSTCAISHSRESYLFRAFGQQLLKLYADHPSDPVRIRFQLKQELHARRVLNGRHRLATEAVREQNRWVTRREAASVLGVPFSVVERLVLEERVVANQRTSATGRTLTIVELTSVKTLRDQHGALLIGADAAARLGLSKTQFRDLQMAGFICPILSPRYPTDVAFYSENEAIMLGNRLDVVAQAGRPADPVDLNWVYRFVHLPDQNLLKWLLPASWDKTVSTYLNPSGKAGIAGFCWSRKEVLDLAKQCRREVTVGVTDLAAQLQMKPEVLNHLAQCGTFPLSELHEVSLSVAREAKQTFEQNYVLLSRVAKARDLSPRWLAVRLAKKGITPVHGPAVDGCRMNIYRRRDIPESLLVGTAP